MQRKLFALAAVMVALVVVLFATRSEPVTYVVRTNAQVPALAAVETSMLSADPIDPRSIEPGTLSGKDAAKLLAGANEMVNGKRALVALGAHQQLRSEYLGLLPQLAADERLVSVSAQTARAVGGTLNAGDRVDVYVATSDGRSVLIDSDVAIVAVTVSQTQLDAASQAQVEDRNKGIGDLLPARPIPGTYILRVTAAKAATYVAGDAAGQLALVLRGEGAGPTPTAAASIQELLSGGGCATAAEGCRTP